MLQSRIYLKDEDLININELLQGGFSIRQILRIIDNDNNHKVISLIKDKLLDGESISNALIYYCNDKYKSYLNNFNSFMSFNHSLKLTINLLNNINVLKNKYLKNLVYPSVMLLFTILGIYFFRLVCFPILSSMMNEFNADLRIAQFFEVSLSVFIDIFFVVILIILVILLLAINKKYRVRIYQFIAKFKLSRIIKLFISNEFVLFFRECTKMGCSTKQSIEILKNIKDKPLINFIASDLEKSFIDGKAIEKVFKTIYLDKSLSTFLKLSLYTSNTEEMLNRYLIISEAKINQFIRKFSWVIKIFSYLTVGMLLIFVYQILLLPLSIISNF